MNLELEVLAGFFTIHRLNPCDELPIQLMSDEIWFSGRSEREFSLVCSSEIQLDALVSDPGWRCLRVSGKLDFDMVGVLAGLTNCLATADIPVFVVSTFETDYLLVKGDRLGSAVQALNESGYSVVEDYG